MATRKTTTRSTTTKAAARKKAPANKPAPAGMLLPVSHEERWRMVAEAAYYIAQRRGFVGGDPTADWAQAEAEVEAKLKQEGRPPA
ncbi:MAG: DUF2934 domain-containing protein [Burkholderiales bacterium]